MTVAQARELQKYLASLSDMMITDNLDAINTDHGDIVIHTHHSVDHYQDRIKPNGRIELDEDKGGSAY